MAKDHTGKSPKSKSSPGAKASSPAPRAAPPPPPPQQQPRPWSVYSLFALAGIVALVAALYRPLAQLLAPPAPSAPIRADAQPKVFAPHAARKPGRQASLKDEYATLTPAPEREIGAEGSLQRDLMAGPTPFTSLVVVNDQGGVPIDVYWGGRLITMAAPGFRASVQSWIGHELEIAGERFVLDGTYAAVVFESSGQPLKRVAQVPPAGQRTKKRASAPKPVPLQSTAKAIKIRNLSSRRMHEFWVPDDPKQPPSYQGVIEPHSVTTTNSYLTHRFQFTELKNKSHILYDFRVNEDQDVYAYVDRATAKPSLLRQHDEEVAFSKDYLARTGRHWYGYYPHRPVKTFLWPADEIGQVHRVHSDHLPEGASGELTLQVVSTQPRAFLVQNFFSKSEAEEIIQRAKDNNLGRSSVTMHDENGQLVESNTRTSKNSWVARGNNVSSPSIDRLFRRAADLLRIDEKYLHHEPPNGTAENMQVVYYGPTGAHYAPHHDWGVHDGPHTRLITLLLYLNDLPSKKSGGETAFPKAQVGKAEGYAIHAGVGNAVMFYSQTPDGNVDDLSLHEAKPVLKGEKWLANFWVHDAVFWRQEETD
jgi:prolyl 4-hydroxylase